MRKRHWLARRIGSCYAMPRLVARRIRAVRGANKALKLVPAGPTEFMHRTTHVFLNHFVKPVHVNPVKVVSISQSQGSSDDWAMRSQRKPLRDGIGRSWIFVPCTTVIGRARSCETAGSTSTVISRLPSRRTRYTASTPIAPRVPSISRARADSAVTSLTADLRTEAVESRCSNLMDRSTYSSSDWATWTCPPAQASASI